MKTTLVFGILFALVGIAEIIGSIVCRRPDGLFIAVCCALIALVCYRNYKSEKEESR